MRVGAAQLRALIEMARSADGTKAVHWASASGLVNRGLATCIDGSLGRRRYPICQITEAGRWLVTGRREAA